MSEERLNSIEREVYSQKTELKMIAGTMEKLVDQGERTHELLNQALLRDERFEAKLQKVEHKLDGRVDVVHDAVTRAHTRIDKTDAAFAKIAWFIVLSVIAALLSLVLVKV